ncbi:hypothetical protein TNCV_3256201 [Trichonephila clavipes]|nr:hypothetical protein TNCV_3256201 [Trichonephila clavipes]
MKNVDVKESCIHQKDCLIHKECSKSCREERMRAESSSGFRNVWCGVSYKDISGFIFARKSETSGVTKNIRTSLQSQTLGTLESRATL